MRVRYAIRWSRLTETVAMAASAIALVVALAGLI
jgi:hypothetical protein